MLLDRHFGAANRLERCPLLVILRVNVTTAGVQNALTYLIFPARGIMSGFLTDNVLIANPAISDLPQFAASAEKLIYVVHHGDDGAVGVCLNEYFGKPLADLSEQYEILASVSPLSLASVTVHSGGPLATKLPWILSRAVDIYPHQINNNSLSLNFSQEAFADPSIHVDALVGLGSFSWGPGQLEKEVSGFVWHCFPAQKPLLNRLHFEHKYQSAVDTLLTAKYSSESYRVSSGELCH